jgi:hypothetical protein
MSDLNAVPAVEVAPATAPVVDPAFATPVPAAAVPAVTPAPVTAPVTEPAAAPTLHDRVSALPKEHVGLLHDILAHIEEGFQEFSLMTGLSRLTSLFSHAKSKL